MKFIMYLKKCFYHNCSYIFPYSILFIIFAGPYIRNWMEGAASWHPTVIGHRLRASHHAYFWLLILRDAISELLRAVSTTPYQTNFMISYFL